MSANDSPHHLPNDLSLYSSCVVIGTKYLFVAMSSSVSFRITRTAEDLVQTITALSQRLVKLEQRQEALEFQLRQQSEPQRIPAEEMEMLDGVEQLLKECQELLDSSDQAEDQAREEPQSWSGEPDTLAA
ncbi:conserved hypothetical protein [Prochlorococcus marinus str. MIT 9313]|uniref:Uncharacterized protein n=2 Tax=Prochlorococcus marinus TaxID=1219 RepID=Q7V9B4_PROMM|nr:conserved hypothetical protein [Prochlorococcus marinus str. MIT 9313]